MFQSLLRRGRMSLLARVLAVLALCVGARAQQATLVGDAHVSAAQPAVNAGGLSNLNVGGGYTALMQFDLGVLPAGTTAAQIAHATLRVYCNRADTPGLVSAVALGGAWTESAVTYATSPPAGAVVGSAQAVAGEFVTFDVTAVVQGWVSSPGTNFGLALTAAAGAAVQFDSKENDQTAHAPDLEIALAAGSTAGGTTGATGATGATGSTGATGPAGVAGPAGATGAAGVAGSAGATGATGAAGAKGATGTTGATGVTGATGIGLAGGAGATGATGATGTPGAPGPTGAVGATGAGVAGATGATGATGLPGLAYEGAYSSVVNYALGDVVLWGGQSYASLVAGNHGQTPSLSPAYWGLLTAAGATGSTGATGIAGPVGATGSIGPAGPQGIQGQAGAQGVAGQAGAQGIQGVTGATGAVGSVGATGVAGPVGLSFQGPYSSTANYALGDGVAWQGAGYVSRVASNHGNTPDQSPAAWALFAASGSPGATGSTGVAGATGTAGINGLNGATGATGSVGATGATGSAGLAYQGAYNSFVNYTLGDVVVWAGQSYASLVAGNHGQTPSFSPTYWGLVAAQGATGGTGGAGATGSVGPQGIQGVPGVAGPQGVQGPSGPQGPAGAQGLAGAAGVQGAQGPVGPQGIAGQAGAQGIQGVTGATGAQGLAGPVGATGVSGLNGATGSTGATGSAGMVYQGAYSSGTNYALGDVVLWGGQSWISLAAGNTGNTPGVNPAAWGLVAALGSTGATGGTGATGAVGPQGLQGTQGVAGPQGVQGPSGPQGPAGAQGLTGAAGVQGAQGPVGPQGVAGQAGAQGIAGVTGATGAAGSAGVAGAAGATGATGATGVNGLNGTPGLTWRGAWASSTAYAVNDAVSAAGTSYISLVGTNVGQAPAISPASWAMLSAAGATGTTGSAGATGVAGAVGATGSTGSVGAMGATGAAGAAGLNFIGAWNAATNYAINSGVSYGGSTYIALAANRNAQPDTNAQAWAVLAQAGGAGPTGAAGAAASVTVGTVTTLAPGSAATVSNSGSGQAAVLNFGIPQGAAGAAGSSGSSGSSNAVAGTFAGMYHAVSFATLYYAVNTPNASATENASVLAWVPAGCTATQLNVYSQQSGSLKVTLRAGATPTALADTALVCSPATNGSCVVTGSVTIAAGEFIDFRFDSASGTPAGVWTALQCQ